MFDIDSTPPADDGFGVARGDPVGGLDDRLEARAAQPVDRERRHTERELRPAARATRERFDGVGWLRDVSEDDVVELGRRRIRCGPGSPS